MTLHEFLEKAGLADRTLRSYHEQGLVPQPGSDGRYGEVHLLRVMAIPLLRGEGLHGATEVKRALDDMSLEALRRYVHGADDDDTLCPSRRATPPAATPAVAAPATPQTSAPPSERHVHIKLRDGIVLDVRLPLDKEGQAIVQKLASMFGFNPTLH
jgi:DNA-binding transcriptional MerR regulator